MNTRRDSGAFGSPRPFRRTHLVTFGHMMHQSADSYAMYFVKRTCHQRVGVQVREIVLHCEVIRY